MPASYDQRAMLVSTAAFRAKVSAAVSAYATYLQDTAPEGLNLDDGSANIYDQKRYTLAVSVNRGGPSMYAEPFCWAVTTNDDVATGGIDAPDETVRYAVETLWDTVAGVLPGDSTAQNVPVHQPAEPEG